MLDDQPSKASLIVYLQEIPWQVFFLMLFALQVMDRFVDGCNNVIWFAIYYR
jgi:hypothetical protein